MDKAKPFDISKRDVQEAFKRVKANRDVTGVDDHSTAAFEKDLSNNLSTLEQNTSEGCFLPCLEARHP